MTGAVTDDREPFREARAAGLKARHEQRLENATYTAAEVKVLTEAALRLGRKEALDEVGERVKQRLAEAEAAIPGPDGEYSIAMVARATAFRDITGHIASLAAPDATSGRTDPEEPK